MEKSQFEQAFRPMSAFEYFWRSILYAIPFIGWILILTNALSEDNNVNVREHARHYLWVDVIALIAGAILFIPSMISFLAKMVTILLR